MLMIINENVLDCIGLQASIGQWKKYTLFFYKNIFYKNIEAEICEI